jgi:hypothetical protein
LIAKLFKRPEIEEVLEPTEEQENVEEMKNIVDEGDPDYE